MLGCDIIEIDRIAKSVEKFGDDFVSKILSSREFEIYIKRGRHAEFLAGRFAGKESVSKSLGTGIGRGYSFTDIEILPDELGKPVVYLCGRLAENIEVSISHSRENAIAVSIKKGDI